MFLLVRVRRVVARSELPSTSARTMTAWRSQESVFIRYHLCLTDQASKDFRDRLERRTLR